MKWFLVTLLISLTHAAPAKPLEVLLILAHYDDETMASSILSRLDEKGANVQAIYLTKGEGGSDIRDQKPVRPLSAEEEAIRKARLVVTREEEIAKAADILNISHIYQIDAGDIPLRIPEEGYAHPQGRPTTSGEQFMQSGLWDLEKIKNDIKHVVTTNNLRPDYIITLSNDSGIIHAHHQAAHAITESLTKEDTFGKQLKGAYAILEGQWYNMERFQTKSSVLYFDVNSFRQGKVRHVEVAHEVYKTYQSQGPSKMPIETLEDFPEMLVPLNNPKTGKAFSLESFAETLGHSQVKEFRSRADWLDYHHLPDQWKLTCNKLLRTR